MTRLAIENNAIFKLGDEKLVFVEKNKAVSVSGTELTSVNLGPQDLISWNISIAARNNFESIVAYWYDKDKAKQIKVEGKRDGEKGKIYTVPQMFSSKESAENKVKSMITQLNESTDQLSLTAIGDPEIMAGGKVTLKGIRSEVDKTWIVKSVTHTINSSGYTSNITAYLYK